MVLVESISEEDYMLVNEAYARKNNITLVKKIWHKHNTLCEDITLDNMFLNDIGRVKRKRKKLCVIFKKVPYFSKNSDVLCKELQQDLNRIPCAAFSINCFELLLGYHEAEECQKYMLSAFKFLLKAFELRGTFSRYSYTNPGRFPSNAIEKMWHYLEVVDHLMLPETVKFWIFHTFCASESVLSGCFCNEQYIKKIIDIYQRQRIDFFGIFKENEYLGGKLCVTNLCLNQHTPKIGIMRSLTLMGAKNTFYKDDYASLMSCLLDILFHHETGEKLYEVMAIRVNIYAEFEKEGLSGNEVEESRRIKFRCYQVLLFASVPSNENPGLALKVLWSTIPDSFLTYEDFLLIHIGEDENLLPEWFKWYESIVSDKKIEFKEPRSLQHLTRCSIRNRLAENFSLPEGIEQLPLPKAFKSYLIIVHQPKRLQQLTKCLIRQRLLENQSLPEGVAQLPVSKELQNYLATTHDPFRTYF